MKCLFNLKMIEGGFIIDHLNDFNMIMLCILFNVDFEYLFALSSLLGYVEIVIIWLQVSYQS
jgi:hypothetical protein